jgi:hypothetical protein
MLQQTTLDSLWNLTAAPSGPAFAVRAAPAPALGEGPPRCAECDGQVVPPGAAAHAAQLRFLLGDAACRGCARVVCDACAGGGGVGDARACLRCSW